MRIILFSKLYRDDEEYGANSRKVRLENVRKQVSIIELLDMLDHSFVGMCHWNGMRPKTLCSLKLTCFCHVYLNARLTPRCLAAGEAHPIPSTRVWTRELGGH